MKNLYKELKNLGMRYKLIIAYLISVFVGGTALIVLLFLGGYLQLLIIVVLLGILVQPYIYLRMRLPIYKEVAVIKKEKDACPHDLKEYYYFSKWVWKSTYLRARTFNKFIKIIYVTLIVIVIIFCYFKFKGIYDLYDIINNVHLIFTVILSAFSILMYIMAIKYFDWICEICESGDNFGDRF